MVYTTAPPAATPTTPSMISPSSSRSASSGATATPSPPKAPPRTKTPTPSATSYTALMPRPRVYATPAIVLRQRKLGDADKILTLYSANKGKLEAVAKGVRRSRSKLAGHVEPLSHANFQLAQGKSLDIVTQCE